MIEIKTEKPVLSFNFNGKLIVSFQTDKRLAEAFNNLPDKPLTVIVKEYKPKRSLDANAKFWTLCGKVSKALGLTKEEIYKKTISEVGEFETVPIRNDAVESYINRWQKNGLGWFCETIGASKLQGYTNIITYFGSSTYDSKEMWRITESICEDCKELGIPTESPDELKRRCEEWGKNGNAIKEDYAQTNKSIRHLTKGKKDCLGEG